MTSPFGSSVLGFSVSMGSVLPTWNRKFSMSGGYAEYYYCGGAVCFCSDVVSRKPPFKLNVFQWFEQKMCEEWWNEGNTPCSYSWDLAIGSVSFSKNVFFLGLEVISTKTNTGSLASHQLRYNCLPIKVIPSWLEFYFIWNHFPLLLLDPAVLYIIYISYKPQVETRNKNKMWSFIKFYMFPPIVLRPCVLQEKSILKKKKNWGRCWFVALLFLFPGKKTGFSLDVVMLFSIERDNSGMDGHIFA